MEPFLRLHFKEGRFHYLKGEKNMQNLLGQEVKKNQDFDSNHPFSPLENGVGDYPLIT